MIVSVIPVAHYQGIFKIYSDLVLLLCCDVVSLVKFKIKIIGSTLLDGNCSGVPSFRILSFEQCKQKIVFCPNCFVRTVLSRLFCPDCFVQTVLSGLFCPDCFVRTVLSGMFCPDCFVRTVLSKQNYPDSFVQTDLSRLILPDWLIPNTFVSSFWF